ncbi:MAG TPA: hypothetical protein PLA14_03065 [Ferruginibacter sp.]|nr:hypothetical protein [Chitinophagaceae bacterium]HQY40732.1 hypothetical protein [Ferruginibacter sp.]
MKNYYLPVAIFFMGLMLSSSKTNAQDKTQSEIPLKFVPFKPAPYPLPDLGKILKSDPGIPVPKNVQKNAVPDLEKTDVIKSAALVKLATEAPLIEGNKNMPAGKNYSKAATESIKLSKP